MDYAFNNIYYSLLFRLKCLLFHSFHEILESLAGSKASLEMPAQFPVLAFHFIYYFFSPSVWLEGSCSGSRGVSLLTLLGKGNSNPVGKLDSRYL